MTEQPPKKSLAEELKRRKTQELQRATETKRVSQATGTVPSSADPKRTSQTTSPVPSSGQASVPSPASPKRATQTTRSAPSAPARSSTDSRRGTQVIGTNKRSGQGNTIPERLAALNQRQKLVLAASGVLIMLICVGTTLFAANQAPPPSPTAAALPTNIANNVLSYMKNVGVPVSNLKTLTVPDKNWKATQAVQFEVHRGTDSGQFILLSYDSLEQANKDAFRAGIEGNFQKWKVMQISNIVMLISPDTALAINDELGSHFMSFLVRPYRDFLPTITPTAAPTTSAPAATAAATSKR